jgi:hypothetical protein
MFMGRGAEVAELLRSGRGVRFQVEGRSMLWTIVPRSTIEVLPCTPSDLVCGDIVLYERHGRFIAHRIVGLWTGPEGSRVLLRGDNLTACDQPIDASAVLGRVVLVDGRLRQLLLLARMLVRYVLANGFI